MQSPRSTDTERQPAPAESSDLAAVAWLCSPAGRREADQVVAELPLSPARVQRLRARVGRREAEWLVTTATLRRAAEEKFGIDGLLVTDRALQQSTDASIARYKASRFPPGVAVWDLCCGIGGDAMALARRGPLIALDRDPVVSRLAAHNLARSLDGEGDAAAAVVCGAVDPQALPVGLWFHIDPDRRIGQRRVADPHHSEPPPVTIDAIQQRAAGGTIKLAPAADAPAPWAAAGAREWISRGGSCRQQVVWFGTDLQPGSRSATMIDSGGMPHTFPAAAETETHRSNAAVEDAAGPLAWMFDFDPAVRAAGLTEALANRLELQTLGGPPGFLTADQLPRAEWAPPALYQAFEVLWQGAMDEKKLRRVLADLGVASLEIKMRGVELTPEQLRKRLLGKSRSGSGRALSLLVGRAELGGRVYAAIAERTILG